MSSDFDDFDKNIENIKSTVKQSFARIYASLKARELKTLRQLEAIRKQCDDDKESQKICDQNIYISYDYESTLLESISKYGVIDFKNINFDNSTFTLEDYISPNDDHMYSYKTLEELTKEDNLEAIEVAALEEITRTEDCVCHVSIKTEDVSRQFRDDDTKIKCLELVEKLNDNRIAITKDNVNNEDVIEDDDDEKSDSFELDLKKMYPTDDWLNSIKSQTETEPTQVDDVMEHSTITCP